MFSYLQAFDRNVGWVTESELQKLRSKRVAIAGLGGVGGAHLLTLTRLGIANFNLADFDCFEIQNFNRQVGANVHTVGRRKLDVMVEMAGAINPEISIHRFEEGVNSINVERFLEGVDLYVDSLDFFVLDMRRQIFELCRQRGIPAITAAPLGMGAALLNFLPGRMSFEEYFRMEGASAAEKAARFFVGLAPARLQMGYLVVPSKIDLAAGRGPSTPMACDLCAGVVGTEALKILLGRGRVIAAPWGVHFDAYTNRLKRTWRPGGNAHPVQRALIALISRRFASAFASPRPEPSTQSQIRSLDPGLAVAVRHGPVVGEKALEIQHILDLARWAPSGDNSQPWRFEIVAEDHVVVHGYDTRSHCVYDLDGRASQLSVGAMLETMRIAASSLGVSMKWARRAGVPEAFPLFDVHLVRDGVAADPLAGVIRRRSVQRKPLSTRALPADVKARLEHAVGPLHTVMWFEGRRPKIAMAWLAVRSAKIRLTIPEAYAVHREIIEWDAQFSDDRVPDQALGADPLTLRSMRWAMGSWSRIEAMNRYFGGTIAPRLQMDFVPALRCAAHFAIVARTAPVGIDDHLAAGGAVQRFWLTACNSGLQLQPQYTPLVFAGYARDRIAFTQVQSARRRADAVGAALTRLLSPAAVENAVFLGRLGSGPDARSRSLRLPIERLRWIDAPERPGRVPDPVDPAATR